MVIEKFSVFDKFEIKNNTFSRAIILLNGSEPKGAYPLGLLLLKTIDGKYQTSKELLMFEGNENGGGVGNTQAASENIIIPLNLQVELKIIDETQFERVININSECDSEAKANIELDNIVLNTDQSFDNNNPELANSLRGIRKFFLK